MAQANRFCTNCGKPIEPGWKFCGTCGQTANAGISSAPPVPPAPAPPSPPRIQATSYTPPGPPAERIIGVVPNVSRRKNIVAVEGFNVIVTGRRLIFAVITNELIKEEAQRSREGAGFFGGLAAAATAGYTLYKRYLTMPPETALAETPANFALERSSVRRVKLEAGKEINSYHNSKANQGSIIKHHQYGNGKFELETASGTLKFEIPDSSFDTASETLKKAGLSR